MAHTLYFSLNQNSDNQLCSDWSYLGREHSSDKQLFQSSERLIKLPGGTKVRQSAVSEFRKANGSAQSKRRLISRSRVQKLDGPKLLHMTDFLAWSKSIRVQKLEDQPLHVADSPCWNFRTISAEARNRVEIRLSYRRARLHMLAESISWNRFLGALKVL